MQHKQSEMKVKQPTPVIEQNDGNKAGPKSQEVPKEKLRLGFIIFGSLISIKIVEYALSRLVKVGDWPYLALLALISAWLIIYYYKHINQIWRSGGRGNE